MLTLEAAAHRARIAERAEALLEAGWADEVRGLLAAGHGTSSPALGAIGYSAVVALIRGEASRDETLATIVRETWRYARRQRTWFRHQLPADAMRLDASLACTDLAATIVEEWRRRRPDAG